MLKEVFFSKDSRHVMISNKSAVHYNADDMVTIVMDIDMQI